MCVKPIEVFKPALDGYEKVLVPCKACYACLKNEVWDLTGRVLCEAQQNDWAFVVTLTYDDKRLYDADQAKMLHWRDFDLFRKRFSLRKKFRYIACGEYGSRGTKRAHWHVLMMGLGIPPNIPVYERASWDAWPYGNIYAEPGSDERKIRYITKYLVKAKRDKLERKTDLSRYRREWIGYSKFPILGIEWIRAYAERQGEMRVFPRSFNYLPPGAHPSKWRYTLQGKAQTEYFDRLFEVWPEGEEAPKTEWMSNAYRRYVKARQRRNWDFLAKNNALHVQAWALQESLRVAPVLEKPKDALVVQREIERERSGVDLSRAQWYERNREALEAEKEATRKWLEERDAERIAVGL